MTCLPFARAHLLKRLKLRYFLKSSVWRRAARERFRVFGTQVKDDDARRNALIAMRDATAALELGLAALFP
jgi:hypothetical protein